MRSIALMATTLLACTAVGQVTIPPHATTYVGFSRGFNFTANTPFFIVGLDLPPDAFLAGSTASYLVRVNGTTALWSIGNAGAIGTNIQVNTGDVVDVIGNWSPAAPTNFTARNSYGNTAPFATTIEGVPHTLNRTGWQWDIGAPTWVSTGTTGTYLAPTTGQIGRVLMYTSTSSGGGTIATNTTLGAGCINVPDVSSYELFGTAAAFDLANTSISLIRTGPGYLAIPGTTAYVAPSGSAQVLTLGDDTEATVTLSQPMPVGASGSTTSLVVCSNGFISAATGNGTGFTPTATTFLNGPQIWWSLGWHDLNPALAGSGQVKFEQVGTTAYITWDGVWDYNGTSATNANTMQAQFDLSTGSVNYVYGTMSSAGATGFLVGFSDAGASADPGSMDISAALPATYSAATFAVRPLTLNASTRPITGTTWSFNTTEVPASGTIGLDILGLSDPNIPDLAFLGAPGCGVRASLDSLNAWIVAGNSHAWSLAIPNDPALVNVHIYAMNAVLQPGVNSFLGGTITSNGIDGKIGTL